MARISWHVGGGFWMSRISWHVGGGFWMSRIRTVAGFGMSGAVFGCHIP